ncbi:uncharacterized protein SPAPADRAFT_65090 [Spathaspora passalidarum NRRL Y-27907]|uniref:Uncharacterized protein n=1 Tax=Spathaspora passalidarum (strain NRRL Y-27907 / 11-Y1) TaxID=619300 RepID=G3AJH3_SPAPN|nr:uncharacterized protein SPAPADRAFT_65090 [Spathaspora passalidarum NRRL Y-27907]EGW33876.1 hypothetical protein SPAPADRAFT_65090 [Spathaspora passalidarum NRRL Y-27907]
MTQLYTTPPLERVVRSGISSSTSSSIFQSQEPSPLSRFGRGISNPFTRIYEPTANPIKRTIIHDNFRYERIPQKINKPDPIVTVIDDSNGLRRNGSIISQDMVLRHRKRIRRRNELLKKEEKEPRKQHRKNQSSKFRFPVRRTRSLQQKSRFHKIEDLAQFASQRDYIQALLTMLPHRMRVFRHSQILKVYPKLTSRLVEFGPRPSIRVIQNKIHKVHPSLKDIVYSKYRQEVFDLKITTAPPKFETLFPNDIAILSKRDTRVLNKRLLLEVLLRRTIAAKMEYRLKQANTALQQETPSYSSSSTSSSSRSADLSYHSQAASFTFGFSSSSSGSSRGNSGHSQGSIILPSPNIKGSQANTSGQYTASTPSYPNTPDNYPRTYNYEHILRQSNVYKLEPRKRSSSTITGSTSQHVDGSVATGSTSWSVIFGTEGKPSDEIQNPDHFIDSLNI